ncbi:hypothetical protein [Kordia sp. SMS9]|uniref:hypothetical protein n=1 Tax=Kordia sp. SMS9 TaxID=2282170 RepID=UPI000E0DC87D|nr:hypothetical protein [Kordia sp. SMS9]
MKKKPFALKLKKVSIADLNSLYGKGDQENQSNSRRNNVCNQTIQADTTCNTFDACDTKCCPTFECTSTSEANSLSDTESLLEC